MFTPKPIAKIFLIVWLPFLLVAMIIQVICFLLDRLFSQGWFYILLAILIVIWIARSLTGG